MGRRVFLAGTVAVAAMHSADGYYSGTLTRQHNHIAIVNLVGESPKLGGGFPYLTVARILVAWLTAQMIQEVIPDGKVFNAPPKVEVDRNYAFPKNKVFEFTHSAGSDDPDAQSSSLLTRLGNTRQSAGIGAGVGGLSKMSGNWSSSIVSFSIR